MGEDRVRSYDAGEHVTAEASDGTPLSVTVLAGRGHPVVMIPGLGSSRHVYKPIIQAWPTDRTLITFDPRGIGDSPPGDAPITLDQLADDALAVLEAVAAGGSLFGASMGGMVALHALLRKPHAAVAAILAATTAGGPSSRPAPDWATERLLGRGARTPGDAYRAACTVLYAPWFQAASPDFIDDEVAYRSAHPVSGRVFAAQRAAVLGHDVAERLGEIRTPLLVLHGEDDLLQPWENGRDLAEGAHAAFHLIPRGGHLFFHETPADSARLMEAFLAEHDR